MSKNWNDELENQAVELYKSGKTPHEIGEIMNKTHRQIIGKLVNLKVYVKPETPEAKPRPEGPTKKELAAVLTNYFPVEIVDGFMPARADSLQALVNVLTTVVESEESEDSDESVAA